MPGTHDRQVHSERNMALAGDQPMGPVEECVREVEGDDDRVLDVAAAAVGIGGDMADWTGSQMVLEDHRTEIVRCRSAAAAAAAAAVGVVGSDLGKDGLGAWPRDMNGGYSEAAPPANHRPPFPTLEDGRA
jgi:hypothetical protein